MQNKLAMQASKNIFVKNFALNLTSIDTVEVILSDWRDTDAGMTENVKVWFAADWILYQTAIDTWTSNEADKSDDNLKRDWYIYIYI